MADSKARNSQPTIKPDRTIPASTETDAAAKERNELLTLKSLVDRGAVNRDSLSSEMRKQLEAFEANQKIMGDSLKKNRAPNSPEDSTGPIFLDYEGDGFRTETPPPGMTDEQLRRWLDSHQEFLRAVKEGKSLSDSQSKSIDTPPSDLKGKELSDWIAKHPNFLRRILGNEMPPESKTKAIEVSDQEAKDTSQVPYGWVQCQCPWDHQGLGITVRGVQWHHPSFLCP